MLCEVRELDGEGKVWLCPASAGSIFVGQVQGSPALHMRVSENDQETVVLIWGLQTSFDKKANLQMWNSRVMGIAWVIFCSFIHQGMNILAVCTFGLLWTMRWAFAHKPLGRYMLSFLWGRYLAVELLRHLVSLCLPFREIAELFSKVVAPLYTPTSSVWGLQWLHILTDSPHSLSLGYSHCSGCEVLPRCSFDLRFPSE